MAANKGETSVIDDWGDRMDDDLLRAARDGDDRAGAFLVSLYAPRLLGYARTIASDLNDADREMVCERAVELACRKIGDFDATKGSFAGWLRGFVRFGVLNWRRSSIATVDSPIESLDPPDSTPATPLPEPDVRAAQLAQAVRELPRQDQLLVALRYREQLPTSEIASRLGLSDDSVRQRLTRLRRRLAKRVSL
jgi:RNA polymerase sigma factor (sigma-70 family)